jgi:tetratricopeptide (TPR) repeat protein
MTNVLSAVVMALWIGVPQQANPPAEAVRYTKNAEAVIALCVAAWEDLKFIDARKLNEEDRKRYAHIRELLGRAQSGVKNSTQGGEMSGPWAMAKEAATEAAALVRRLLKLDEYAHLVDQYRSGAYAAAAVAGAGWLESELEKVVRLLEAHSAGPARLGERGSVVEAFTTEILSASVVLHTQIAFDLAQPGPHLRVARRLLTLLDDAALPKDFRRQWYLAAAAHLQGQLDLPTAVAHVDEAVARFPGDVEILIAAGALDELLALPSTELRARILIVGPTDLGSKRSAAVDAQLKLGELATRKAEGLLRAEALYRKALAIDPTCAEAHLRLGRVLHLSGRLGAGLEEIRLASTSGDNRIRYLGSMFAGAIHQSAGRPGEAVAQYRSATRQCPDCLVGAIALSHALRQSGDRGLAAGILDSALARDNQVETDDPWWYYPLGGFWRRDRMLDGLRRSIEGAHVQGTAATCTGARGPWS